MINNVVLSPSQVELRDFLAARAAKFEAMVKEGHFVCYNDTSVEEWAEQGVTSVEQWKSYWEVIEEQERAKEERKNWYRQYD